MITPGGLFVPDPKPEPPKIELVLTGRGGLLARDDGYQGEVIIRKGELEVCLRITEKEHETLSKMGISEYT